MEYILHYAPDNASMIIRLALEKTGVPYRCALVDRRRKAQRAQAYLDLNPQGLIPTLETDQGPIFETAAILLWLADRHGGLGPAPDSPCRGAFLKWLFFLSNTLHPALNRLFYPHKYVGTDRPSQEALHAQTQRDVLKHFDTLNSLATAGHSWCAGSTPSAIDFYIAAFMRWPALYPLDRERSWYTAQAYPALFDMCQRLEAHHLVQCLMLDEGMNATPFTAPQYPNPPQGSAL